MPVEISEIRLGARKVNFSNVDKVFYPKTKFTKGQLIRYYYEISSYVLPHLKDRPLTLKRYPNGVEGEHFYEKRCPKFKPEWIKTARVYSNRHEGDIFYCMVNDLASLMWVANLADLELHTSLSKFKNMSNPTMMMFDLDPGAGMTILDCCRVALLLKKLLRKVNLESFAKTSGSKGLQVCVPLNTKTSYEETKSFSRAVAELMSREHPDLVIAQMAKVLRERKVFIDWSQNDEYKTTVCVYSLRAMETPTVSAPLQWSEVQRGLRSGDPGSLVFDPDKILSRAKKYGDLFGPLETMKQVLPKFG
jgi:bifunctional non-homologous end joining protein LigD